MTAPIVYFARRASDLIRQDMVPPSHLRKSLYCDHCKQEVWVNKESWEQTNRRVVQQIVCSVCYLQGRHRTG